MLRSMIKDPNTQINEYSSIIRYNVTEWNEFLNFIFRKTESFIQMIIFEVFIPSYLTEDNKIYAPRFLDEIADEIDVLENKKDTLFSRNRLRRLLIPMLIVLKLFKLKLLLFLPLILGVVSFKKFLGFLIIVIPSLIAFLKLYTPIAQTYSPPVYLPSGVGFPLNQIKENYALNHNYELYQLGPTEYSDQNYSVGQKLAYQGYEKYKK